MRNLTNHTITRLNFNSFQGPSPEFPRIPKCIYEELIALFNGIGSEAFPSWLRTDLDALHPSLAPVAMIHDVEWSESDGKEETFSTSNARFRRNGCKVASASFGWWRPRRYLVMWDSVKFARICQRFDWSAFLAPYEAREKGGEA